MTGLRGSQINAARLGRAVHQLHGHSCTSRPGVAAVSILPDLRHFDFRRPILIYEHDLNRISACYGVLLTIFRYVSIFCNGGQLIGRCSSFSNGILHVHRQARYRYLITMNQSKRVTAKSYIYILSSGICCKYSLISSTRSNPRRYSGIIQGNVEGKLLFFISFRQRIASHLFLK